MKNRTAFLTDSRKLEIFESEMPISGCDDLLIKVNHVGVCGSDLSIFATSHDSFVRQSKYPVVLGHECAGEVVEAGKNASGFKTGDRVAVEPGVPCMKCEYCMTGRYNLCDRMNFMACPPWERAALSEYISHPAVMCFKLPDNVSTLEGALVEPFSVGMHAVKRAEAAPGQTVLIIGSGCIGLTVLLACKVYGASIVYVADMFDLRLNKAKELGATETINSNDADLADKIMELTCGKGVDIVFEAAGNPTTAEVTQKTVKKGGKIVIVGNIHGAVPFDLMRTASREVDIIGIFRYRNQYPTAIEAISSGLANIQSICTDLYPFDQVQRGFEDAYERKMEVVKAVIEM